jgi:phytoene dehydrogenase-like protein
MRTLRPGRRRQGLVSPNSAHDVIVIGGGHNGLVAAYYLAASGLRTLVLERRPIIGGACVTETFAPGYRASPGAYVLSMLRPAVRRDMRLDARGLTVSPAGPTLNIFGDGSSLMIGGDGSEGDDVAHFSQADARALPRFKLDMEAIGRAVMPLLDESPPDPSSAAPRDLADLARAGRRAFAHRRVLQEAAYLTATTASQYLGERFESEEVKSALGWDVIGNTLAGPTTPGTAFTLLHEHGFVNEDGSAWGFVRGGMGTVTGLMAEAAREAGAEIRADSAVERILVEQGAAVGVLLADGTELRARTVLSNADPKRTFLSLLDAGDLPAEFVGAVRAYRCDGATMKINLAVSELPQLPGARSSEPRDYHRGLVQVTHSLDVLDRHQTGARYGEPAPNPHIELCFPSVHDASLAPPGCHVVTIGARSQPYRLAEGSWPERRDAVADGIVARLGEVFPNLTGSIVARQVLSPFDLEGLLGLTGGHHMHGDMAPDQLFFLRPVRGFGRYRTPVSRLYLCGSGTHPGGGVTGASGRNCAREVLRNG